MIRGGVEDGRGAAFLVKNKTCIEVPWREKDLYQIQTQKGVPFDQNNYLIFIIGTLGLIPHVE